MRASDRRGLGALCAALVLACALALPASAQQNDAAKKEIQAALDQCCACLTAKDLDGYGKHLTTDYRRIDFFGDATDREKAMAYLRTLLEPASDLSTTATVESIRIKGDEATVLVRMKGKATSRSEDARATPVAWEQREVQVWTKTPDGWRLRDSMGLTESILVDGKPYAPETTNEAAAARTSIQSVYNALVRAAVEGNADAVRGVVPAGFVLYPTAGGPTRNREQFVAEMKDLIGAKGGPADFKLERAMLRGDRAIVLGQLRVESTETVDGQSVKTTTTTWHRDVWEKDAAGKWQPVEFRPVLRERMVGGKIGSAIFVSPGPRS